MELEVYEAKKEPWILKFDGLSTKNSWRMNSDYFTKESKDYIVFQSGL